MGLWKKFTSLFSPASNPEGLASMITVRCNRCGEIIQARLNLYNDLSIQYDDTGAATYFCRKMLMGKGHCFQRVEVELTFDANRKLLNKEITGGQFVEAGKT
jgi:DNA-directed RNA polymerase subunit N (RpoN/RPB10)